MALRVLNAIRKVTTPTACIGWQTVRAGMWALMILPAEKVEMGKEIRREWTGWCWWEGVSGGPCVHPSCACIS